jgi:hypothetical protein
MHFDVMTSEHDRAPAVETALEAPPAVSEVEPFGQRGVRQYVMPALTVLSFVVTCLAGVMWYRSYSVADQFAREDGVSTLLIRSIYGRVVMTYSRLDASPDSASRYTPEWRYSTSEMPEVVRDAWRDSWKKRIGIDWRGEPLLQPELAVGGWWLRVRWPLIAVLSLVVPVARALAHQRRVMRQKRVACPS